MREGGEEKHECILKADRAQCALAPDIRGGATAGRVACCGGAGSGSGCGGGGAAVLDVTPTGSSLAFAGRGGGAEEATKSPCRLESADDAASTSVPADVVSAATGNRGEDLASDSLIDAVGCSIRERSAE